MCVIFVAFKNHPRYPLIVLANRDEFYDRPTAAALRWVDHPHVTAGRDLVGGGTWLGIAEGGRFAAVTNYRDPSRAAGMASRGRLVADFLVGNGSTTDFMDEVAANARNYSGFNLLAGSTQDLYYLSNVTNDPPQKLEPGRYGLSNHLLNTAWPKVSNGLAAFERLIADDEFSHQKGFELLADETLAADDELPETCIGIEKERVLSPIFIRTPIYGTRNSTIVLSNSVGDLELEERVFV